MVNVLSNLTADGCLLPPEFEGLVIFYNVVMMHYVPQLVILCDLDL